MQTFSKRLLPKKCKYCYIDINLFNSVLNGQKMNGTGATNTSTTNSSSVVASTKNTSSAATSGNTNRQKVVNNRDCHYSGYPKPAYSNACLIALGNFTSNSI